MRLCESTDAVEVEDGTTGVGVIEMDEEDGVELSLDEERDEDKELS